MKVSGEGLSVNSADPVRPTKTSAVGSESSRTVNVALGVAAGSSVTVTSVADTTTSAVSLSIAVADTLVSGRLRKAGSELASTTEIVTSRV